MNSTSFSKQMNSISNGLNQTYDTISNTLENATNITPIIETPIMESPVNTPTISNPLDNLPIGWLLFFILLILMFLGINVFYVASKGSEVVGDVGEGIFGHLKGLFLWTIMQIKILLGITSKGSKVAIDIAHGTADSGLELVEKTVNAPKTVTQDNIGKTNIPDKLASGIEVPQPTIDKIEKELLGEEPKAKESGYCYIGNKSVGSCAFVNQGDYCMSGNIFPTMSQCINKENARQ